MWWTRAGARLTSWALLTRPDGRELQRWIDADADAAATEEFDWAALGGFRELEPGPGEVTDPLTVGALK
jgi:hypothetical protein